MTDEEIRKKADEFLNLITNSVDKDADEVIKHIDTLLRSIADLMKEKSTAIKLSSTYFFAEVGKWGRPMFQARYGDQKVLAEKFGTEEELGLDKKKVIL